MTLNNLTDLTAQMLGMDEASQLDASQQALIAQALNQAVSLACIRRRMPLYSESVTLDGQGMGKESLLAKQVWRILAVERENSSLAFTRLWKNGETYYSVPGHGGESVTIHYTYLPGTLTGTDVPPLPEWFQPFLADYAAAQMLNQGDPARQRQLEHHLEHWYEGLAHLEPIGGRENRFRNL